MAIKFRCTYCRQLLGISTTKAGTTVDCPACGRSVNVPAEGGTASPPQQNLRPSDHPGLLDALHELSALGNPEASQSPASATSHPKPANRKPPTTQIPNASADSSATPNRDRDVIRIIPLAGSHSGVESVKSTPDRLSRSSTPKHADAPQTPLMPEVPGHSIEEERESASKHRAPHESAETIVWDNCADSGLTQHPDDLASALHDLAATVPGTSLHQNLDRDGQDAPRPRASLMPIMLILPAFAIGLLLGTFWQSSESDRSPRRDSSTNKALARVDVPPAAGNRSLKGVIAWTDDAGKSSPDEGAMILLLPIENPTGLRFDGRPLREAADSRARIAIEAALKSLGAFICQANSTGAWEIEVPEDSSLTMIVVSKHRSRSSEQPPPGIVTDTLSQWFESPLHVIGRLAVQQQTISPADSESTANSKSDIVDVEFTSQNQ